MRMWWPGFFKVSLVAAAVNTGSIWIVEFGHDGCVEVLRPSFFFLPSFHHPCLHRSSQALSTILSGSFGPIWGIDDRRYGKY